MTRTEEVLQALLVLLLAGVTGPQVLRNDGLTDLVPPEGRVVLQDGDPGEPETTMSPLTYHYQHRAEIEIYAQNLSGRDAVFDGLKAQIGAAIAADRTLGGICDWVEPLAPRPLDLQFEGALPIKAATITVVLHYSTTNPLT
jgi:hypothetical protein